MGVTKKVKIYQFDVKLMILVCSSILSDLIDKITSTVYLIWWTYLLDIILYEINNLRYTLRSVFSDESTELTVVLPVWEALVESFVRYYLR